MTNLMLLIFNALGYKIFILRIPSTYTPTETYRSWYFYPEWKFSSACFQFLFPTFGWLEFDFGAGKQRKGICLVGIPVNVMYCSGFVRVNRNVCLGFLVCEYVWLHLKRCFNLDLPNWQESSCPNMLICVFVFASVRMLCTLCVCP